MLLYNKPQQLKRTINMKIIIKPSHKYAAGHQTHISGTGVHGDKRTKRNRTRGNQRVKIRLDWEN